MLEVRNARKVFYRGKPDEKIALNDLNLKLGTGEFGIIIGTNGAGKSTMLNAISGALPLDSGSVVVGHEDVTDLPVHKRAERITRVFQDPMKGTAASMTIAENMLLAELRVQKRTLRPGLTAARRTLYRERLSVLGLGLEDRLDARVDLLSGGQRQSLSLVMAVSTSPQLLLLDEHTAALDPRTADLVMAATVKAVEAFKLTVLMVTHNMQHAIDFGHRVFMVDAGRVKLEIGPDEKKGLTVPDLISHFSTKSDRMLLAS
ncbi:ABC transporter ATP-binding protein [Diaphorobacter sp. HDW4A]|uniref:ABC transporter ATP-binding protein n=1 Tax=Diaphorobacter sp. HDW4A TaxID=2714924 RepID=UPI00140B70F5|nr:ABC transporter ATP-binding protein [Diaphorobacter sp. HDW4A]QIL79675.1 ABC transporter ATP-binding protein [Diaphorobacter sp. HDW4A]